MSQEKPIESVQVVKDPVFPLWKLEKQVAEQLRRGVKVIGGAEVAVSVGSAMFTYVKKTGKELTVKYVEGCVAVTASAILTGEEEAKVYDVTIHNICGDSNI